MADAFKSERMVDFFWEYFRSNPEKLVDDDGEPLVLNDDDEVTAKKIIRQYNTQVSENIRKAVEKE